MTATERTGRHRAARSRRKIISKGAALAAMALTAVPVGIGLVLTGPDGDGFSSNASSHSGSQTTLPRPDAGSPSSRPVAPQQTLKPTAPPSAAIMQVGPGTFRTASAGTADSRRESLTYTIEVEHGLPFNVRETAQTINGILGDSRGWGDAKAMTFRQVAGSSDARILLASPATTDALCAPLRTSGEVSCRNGPLVVLNARRWATATEDYADDIDSYRIYLVNHEVGHLVGEAHQECPGPNQPAPVMQQQTYGLDGCRRNVWPQHG